MMFFNVKDYLKVQYPSIGVIKRMLVSAGTYKNYGVPKSNVLILCYHRIGYNEPDPYLVNVCLENFKQQMRLLHEEYKILRLNDELKSKKKAIVVTFDDGYLDNYYHAYPVLREYGIPATFFIPTDNLGLKKELWDQDLLRILYYRTNDNDINIVGNNLRINDENLHDNIFFLHKIMLEMKPWKREEILHCLAEKLKPSIACRKMSRVINKNELKELSRNELMDIGVHTCTHTALANLTYEEQFQEISKSKAKLEYIIDKKVDSIAYPFGRKKIHYTETTIDIVKELNLSRAVTTNNGQVRDNSSMFELPRIHVGDWDRQTFSNMLHLYWMFG